jgi:hypothetical protein
MSKQFLCILRNPKGGCESSSSNMEEMYAKFQQWHNKFADNIVDIGGKLINEGKVLSSEGVTDGPYIESKEIIGGFMIVSATDVDLAVEIVKACPPVATSLSTTTVEVRELARA